MAEEQDGLAGGTPWAEAEFEDVAEGFLFVPFDAAAEGAGDLFYMSHGGVDCWSVLGRRLSLDQALEGGAEPLLVGLHAGEDGGGVDGG